MQNQPQKLTTQEKDAAELCLDDIIDVSRIDFDDEHWLSQSEIITVTDLNKWLEHDSDSDSSTFSSTLKKTIDSTTYTRSKKKHTRPSTEKNNEDYFEAEKKMLDLSDDIHTDKIDPNITINESHTLLNFTCRKSNPNSNNTFEKLADQIFENKCKTQPEKLDTFEKSDLNEIFLKTTDNVSNSSRGSTQMMMAEVDAIVKIQENSFPAMSTPEPGTILTNFFENTYLSPIPNLNIKEPDKPALERNARNLNNLKTPKEYHNPRSINTITSNLKTTTIPTFKGLYSNPETVNSKLRSSSKAIVPDIDLTVTNTLEGPGRQDVLEMPLPPKESKPSAIRMSRLPRPIGSATGIPRPTSKIPVPKQIRSSSVRELVPIGSATGIPRPTSKIPVPKQIRSSFARELVPIGSATGIPRPTSKIPVPKQIRSSSARELVRPNSKKFK